MHEKVEETPYFLAVTDITFSKDEHQDQLNQSLLEHRTFWNTIRFRCGFIINDTRVQKFLLFLIILNSIILGILTFDFISNTPFLYKCFTWLDFISLCIFSIEICMQIIYRQFDTLKDGWLVWDMIVIGMSLIIESIKVGRGFRIIRASRMLYRIHGLRSLIKALHECIAKIFSVAILLLLIVYVYGVILTSLFKDMYKDGYLDEDFFGRLDKSFFTLFQMMTLDTWSSIAKQVMAIHPWSWLIFVSFILITTFLILNLAFGVIGSAVASAQKDEFETTIMQVSSDVGERNDKHIRALEKKIDNLTHLVEMLVRDRDKTVRSD